LWLLQPYSSTLLFVLGADAVVAFSSFLVALSSPDASTHGFFVSGSTGHPSGNLLTSVVTFFTFSLGSP
jgi:hypothetical protein